VATEYILPRGLLNVAFGGQPLEEIKVAQRAVEAASDRRARILYCVMAEL